MDMIFEQQRNSKSSFQLDFEVPDLLGDDGLHDDLFQGTDNDFAGPDHLGFLLNDDADDGQLEQIDDHQVIIAAAEAAGLNKGRLRSSFSYNDITALNPPGTFDNGSSLLTAVAELPVSPTTVPPTSGSHDATPTPFSLPTSPLDDPTQGAGAATYQSSSLFQTTPGFGVKEEQTDASLQQQQQGWQQRQLRSSGDTNAEDSSSVQTSQEVKATLSGKSPALEASSEVPDSSLPTNINIPPAMRHNMPEKMKRLLEQIKGKSREEAKQEILREIENEMAGTARAGGMSRVASQPNFSLAGPDMGSLGRLPSLGPGPPQWDPKIALGSMPMMAPYGMPPGMMPAMGPMGGMGGMGGMMMMPGGFMPPMMQPNMPPGGMPGLPPRPPFDASTAPPLTASHPAAAIPYLDPFPPPSGPPMSVAPPPVYHPISTMEVQHHVAGMRKCHSSFDIAVQGSLKSLGGGDVSFDTMMQELMAQADKRVGKLSPEQRKSKILRYRQKRHERNFRKRVTYQCRKTLADTRPRVRGRFARTEDDKSPLPPSLRLLPSSRVSKRADSRNNTSSDNHPTSSGDQRTPALGGLDEVQGGFKPGSSGETVSRVPAHSSSAGPGYSFGEGATSSKAAVNGEWGCEELAFLDGVQRSKGRRSARRPGGSKHPPAIARKPDQELELAVADLSLGMDLDLGLDLDEFEPNLV